MVQGGAAGLPPLFAETLLGLPLKAEFPAGASAKRAAIPAPNRSVLPKTMVQSEGGQEGENSFTFKVESRKHGPSLPPLLNRGLLDPGVPCFFS
jgi:hypothetical protein